MLKKTITYEDFNGEKQSQTFYFNLTRTEIIRMESSVDGGLANALTRIVESKNSKDILEQFEQIVTLAYGVKSDDGQTFEKSDELREKFLNHAAYDELFIELVSNQTTMAAFINGIVPKAALEAMQAAQPQDKPVGPPPVPVPPTQ